MQLKHYVEQMKEKARKNDPASQNEILTKHFKIMNVFCRKFYGVESLY